MDVTTVFDLYGSNVEPFENGKQDAVKKAIVQVPIFDFPAGRKQRPAAAADEGEDWWRAPLVMSPETVCGGDCSLVMLLRRTSGIIR